MTSWSVTCCCARPRSRSSALDGNGLSAADRAFYEGKPAVARFFALTVLPELAARRQVAEGIDNSLMDVSEAAF